MYVVSKEKLSLLHYQKVLCLKGFNWCLHRMLLFVKYCLTWVKTKMFKLISIYNKNAFICDQMWMATCPALVAGRIRQQSHIPEHLEEVHCKFPKSAANTRSPSEHIISTYRESWKSETINMLQHQIHEPNEINLWTNKVICISNNTTYFHANPFWGCWNVKF